MAKKKRATLRSRTPRRRRLVPLDDELSRLREAFSAEVEKNRTLAKRNDELVRRIDGTPVVPLRVGDPPDFGKLLGVSASITLALGVELAQWLYTDLRKIADNRASAIREALGRVIDV